LGRELHRQKANALRHHCSFLPVEVKDQRIAETAIVICSRLSKESVQGAKNEWHPENIAKPSPLKKTASRVKMAVNNRSSHKTTNPLGNDPARYGKSTFRSPPRGAAFPLRTSANRNPCRGKRAADF
jgi:hypothetical protein